MAPRKSVKAEVVEESGDSESEQESEYEIEEVLDAQKGLFPAGRYGYLVSWKGYGTEHNSWQDEEDMEHASDLIEAYWARRKNEKKQDKSRKSISAPVKAKNRSESIPSPPPAKKRGRPSKAASETAMDVDEEEETPPQKKTKKTTTSTTTTTKVSKKAASAEKVDTEVETGDMSEYKDVPSWDHLVSSIDTVEQGGDLGLFVYFTLNKGEKHRVGAQICHAKMPDKLLDFYERNLKWRTADGVPTE